MFCISKLKQIFMLIYLSVSRNCNILWEATLVTNGNPNFAILLITFTLMLHCLCRSDLISILKHLWLPLNCDISRWAFLMQQMVKPIFFFNIFISQTNTNTSHLYFSRKANFCLIFVGIPKFQFLMASFIKIRYGNPDFNLLILYRVSCIFWESLIFILKYFWHRWIAFFHCKPLWECKMLKKKLFSIKIFMSENFYCVFMYTYVYAFSN